MSWLDDHPPVRSQYRRPRREAMSGVYGVHTFEGVMDDVGPDTGAENGVGFIQRRGDAGSYHDAVDSDSAIDVVSDDAEAFSIAVDGHNRHTVNLSFACRTVDLHPADGWTHRAMANAGRAMVARWDRNGFCPECSARWLDPGQVAQLRARRETCRHGRWAGGLVCHGTVQPADRSDAWARHPFRPELEQLLVSAILVAAGVAGPTPPPEEAPVQLTTRIATDEVYGQLFLTWAWDNNPPHDIGYLRSANDIAVATSIYGATPYTGPQGALVDWLLEQTQKDRPGEGETITAAQLAGLRDEIIAGIRYILESDGRDPVDVERFATEVVDQLGARLTAPS